MDRGTIPQQHPMQEPLISHPSAKPLDQLLACALGAPVALAEGVGNILVLRHVLHHTFRGAFHDELGHDGACHGHDRRDREISLVSGADEEHQSVLLRSRPAAVPQAQELRGRLVHVDDAGRVHSVLRHVVHQAQSDTCVSTSLGSVVFLVPPDAARYLKPAQRRKWRIHRLRNLRAMPCWSATLSKMGCITAAEIGTPASPTRSHFSRRMGMIASTASRGSRPSFLFSEHDTGTRACVLRDLQGEPSTARRSGRPGVPAAFASSQGSKQNR